MAWISKRKNDKEFEEKVAMETRKRKKKESNFDNSQGQSMILLNR